MEVPSFRLRRLVEADLYPCFTLAAQTMAGFVLGFEALLKLNPSVFIDTMGYSLTLPLFRSAFCKNPRDKHKYKHYAFRRAVFILPSRRAATGVQNPLNWAV